MTNDDSITLETIGQCACIVAVVLLGLLGVLILC